jgi:hypothetical protein
MARFDCVNIICSSRSALSRHAGRPYLDGVVLASPKAEAKRPRAGGHKALTTSVKIGGKLQPENNKASDKTGLRHAEHAVPEPPEYK